ncbi:MAG: MerR family transcriptional regulator [Chitinophagaceae bacterium]
MKSVRQITFDFSAEAPETGIAGKENSSPVINQPKKRGRKPRDPSTIFKKPPAKRGRKSLKEVETEADLIEIPEDELLFQKQYYSMSEVATMFHINHSLLRFWENEFDILKPKKNKKGDRYFRPADIKNLHLIHHLVRQRKYTMEGAKEYIKNNHSKADAKFEMIQSLQRIRTFLLEIKSSI